MRVRTKEQNGMQDWSKRAGLYVHPSCDLRSSRRDMITRKVSWYKTTKIRINTRSKNDLSWEQDHLSHTNVREEAENPDCEGQWYNNSSRKRTKLTQVRLRYQADVLTTCTRTTPWLSKERSQIVVQFGNISLSIRMLTYLLSHTEATSISTSALRQSVFAS